MSQLDLAVDAEVSARHLSFIETGRARPSRDLVIHLAEHLEVPLRERNNLLLAAGYAPVYAETPLDAAEMDPVRSALDAILASHDPYPAIVVDRVWDVVATNAATARVLSAGVSPALLAPPANALRVTLHPDGLAPRIANFSEYAHHLMARLARQVALSADPALRALESELHELPGVAAAALPGVPIDKVTAMFMPLVLRTAGADDDARPLRMFSTLSTFGSALDITVAELSIEAFFPADDYTAAALRDRA